MPYYGTPQLELSWRIHYYLSVGYDAHTIECVNEDVLRNHLWLTYKACRGVFTNEYFTNVRLGKKERYTTYLDVRIYSFINSFLHLNCCQRLTHTHTHQLLFYKQGDYNDDDDEEDEDEEKNEKRYKRLSTCRIIRRILANEPHTYVTGDRPRQIKSIGEIMTTNQEQHSRAHRISSSSKNVPAPPPPRYYDDKSSRKPCEQSCCWQP
jgi:hypothetical protein